MARTDCGAQHGKVIGSNPNTTTIGPIAAVRGTSASAEYVASCGFMATLSVGGVNLTSSGGDGIEGIVCNFRWRLQVLL